MADETDDTPTTWAFLDDHIVLTAKKEVYRFKVPSIAQLAAIGSRAASIRRMQDPNGVGDIRSLDGTTLDMIWGFAAFEILLDKTSVEWPVSKDKDGRPVVDHTKWPLARMNDFMEVALALNIAISRFRDGRVEPGQFPPAEIVDGGKDTGAQ